MSKGSNTTTQTTNSSGSVSPSDPAMAAYMGLLNRAQTVSNTPFAPYQGPEVAPTNETQLYGINTGQQAAAGLGQYASNAGGYMNDAGQWVQASDIDRYMDPYTQQVINATQRDFDVQNQRAASVTAGDAAKIGSLGGNSTAVAKALTQEGQERVQAPVMATLRSRGFEDAEQMANLQKNRELQAGQVLSGADLAAAQQQFAFGTQEQQTQQAQYTQQMTDYYMQQGYPFATAQWLAAITLGTGPQMGQTSTGTGTQVTQGPQPNQWMQALGLGVAAAGAFAKSDERLKEDIHEIGRLHDGQKIYRYRFKGEPQVHVGMLSQEVEKHHPEAVREIGGFGAVNYDTATRDAIKKRSGGTVRGFAPGGAPQMGATPYGSSSSGWVPVVSLPGVAPMQATLPKFSDPKTGNPNQAAYGAIGKGLGSLNGPGLSEGFGKIGSGISDFLGMGSGAGTAFDPSGYGFYPSGADGLSGGAGGSLFAYNTGGSVPVSSGFAGGIELPRRGYQSRGAVPPVNNDDTIDATDVTLGPSVGGTWDQDAADISRRLAANDPAGPGDSPRNASMMLPVSQTGGSREPVPQIPVPTQSFRATGFSPETPAQSGNPLATGFGPEERPPVIQAADKSPALPGGPASPVEPQSSGFGFRMSDEARQGLIAAGLSMMANRVGGKGSFLAGVGDAGAQGMNTYAQARNATIAQDALRRREAFEREKYERQYTDMTAAQKLQLKMHQQTQRRADDAATRAERRLDLMEQREQRAEEQRKLALDPQSGLSQPIRDAMANNVHGKEFLDVLDPAERNVVEAVGNYDMSPTDAFSKLRGTAERKRALVIQFNPDYNDQWYKMKGAALKNFYASSSPQSPVVLARAYNTSVGHAGDLAGYFDELRKVDPSGWQGFLKEARDSGTGLISYAAASAMQRAAKGTPAGEVWAKIGAVAPLYVAETSRFYSGSTGAQEEKDTIRKPLDPNLSFPEVISALHAQSKMFKSKVDPLEAEYKDVMDAPGLARYGTKKEQREWHATREHAQAALDRIEQLYNDRQQSVSKLPPANKREVGKVYATPKGDLEWTGTGWKWPEKTAGATVP